MVQTRLAKNDDERVAAGRLVYERYVEVGFIKPDASEVFLCDWPGALTFVAMEGDTLEGTLTLVARRSSGSAL
jgi:hypothetical protein